MTTPVASLSDAFSTVRANPRFTALTGVIMLLTVGGGTILSIVPLVGQIASNAIIGMVGGGIVAAIAAGTTQQATGTISVNNFTSQLSSYAVPLCGAYLLAAAVYVGLTIVGIIAVFGAAFVESTATGFGQAGTVPASSVGVLGGAVVLLLVITFLLAAIAFQFLNVAVVIDDQSVTGAFREALNTVISNPLSVIGYSLLRGLSAVAAVLLLIAIIAGANTVSEPLALASAAVSIPIVGSVAVTVFYAHHTHYYRRLRHN